jgi:hypothetical protein
MKTGQVISAEVLRIDHNFVVVNAGLKSEAFIPVEEFHNDAGEIEVNPGDFVSVAIDALENGYGDTILSRDKAKRLASWMNLEKALEQAEIVTGTVTGKVKGGGGTDSAIGGGTIIVVTSSTARTVCSSADSVGQAKPRKAHVAVIHYSGTSGWGAPLAQAGSAGRGEPATAAPAANGALQGVPVGQHSIRLTTHWGAHNAIAGNHLAVTNGILCSAAASRQ